MSPMLLQKRMHECLNHEYHFLYSHLLWTDSLPGNELSDCCQESELPGKCDILTSDNSNHTTQLPLCILKDQPDIRYHFPLAVALLARSRSLLSFSLAPRVSTALPRLLRPPAFLLLTN